MISKTHLGSDLKTKLAVQATPQSSADSESAAEFLLLHGLLEHDNRGRGLAKGGEKESRGSD